jgi:hypothetical protein
MPVTVTFDQRAGRKKISAGGEALVATGAGTRAHEPRAVTQQSGGGEPLRLREVSAVAKQLHWRLMLLARSPIMSPAAWVLLQVPQRALVRVREP